MKRVLAAAALLGSVLSSVLVANSAHANDGPRTSRVGAEMKGITNSGSQGVLFGWRYVSFESEFFSVGGAGYTGQLSGTNVGSFTYGGLLVNYTRNISGKFDFEIALLGGGAGGFAGTTTGGGIVLEPTLSGGFVLGKAVRMVLDAGYVWMPGTTNFSGITYGLRVDFLLNALDDSKSTASTDKK